MRLLANTAFGIIVLVVVLGAAVGLAVWNSVTSGLSDRIAAEALDAGAVSLLISLMSGGVAILAYARAVRSPRLQLCTTIHEDYVDAAGKPQLNTRVVVTAKDVSLHKSQFAWTQEGLTLLITLKNDRAVAAVHPAVRVTLVEFGPSASIKVDQVQWVHLRPPAGASFAFAWQWSGVDITVPGPGWEASLPVLSLAGLTPEAGAKHCLIDIAGVADGADSVRQIIRIAGD